MFSRRTRFLIRLSLAAVLFMFVAAASGCARKDGPLTAEQKLEDFQYLFETFRSSHPYLDLKIRTDEYDWLAHEREFAEMIGSAGTDAEFAQVISYILGQLNNGHTWIASGDIVQFYRDSAYLAWMAQCRNTTPERADYWYDLAMNEKEDDSDLYYSPFVAQYVNGRYLVFAVSPEAGVGDTVKIASEVTALSGVPVRQYVKEARETDFMMYNPERDELYVQYLVPPLLDGEVEVTFRQEDGRIVEASLAWTKDEWEDDYCYPPVYDRKATGCTDNVYTAVIADGKVGYVQVSEMVMDDGEDRETLKAFFARVKDLPAIIIDIRGNPGGSDSYWENNLIGLLSPKEVTAKFACTWRTSDYLKPFVNSFEGCEIVGKTTLREMHPDDLRNLPPEVLSDGYAEPRMLQWTVYPDESVNYEGRVLLLVDGLVYSSAESFAAFCKASGWAEVYGGTTGGDGIAIDPAVLTLPNSGMVVRFPSVMGLNPDWSANEEKHTAPYARISVSPSGFRKYVEWQAEDSVKEPNLECDILLKVTAMDALDPR